MIPSLKSGFNGLVSCPGSGGLEKQCFEGYSLRCSNCADFQPVTVLVEFSGVIEPFPLTKMKWKRRAKNETAESSMPLPRSPWALKKQLGRDLVIRDETESQHLGYGSGMRGDDHMNTLNSKRHRKNVYGTHQ